MRGQIVLHLDGMRYAFDIEFDNMADLVGFGLQANRAEARLRALLDDLVQYHKGVYPNP